MTRRTSALLVACLSSCWVGCAGDPVVPSPGDDDTPPRFQVVAQPDNQGQALLDAIAAAQTSIDITIYQLNAPEVNQALVDAIAQGVNVRVVYNGRFMSERDYSGAVESTRVLLAAAEQYEQSGGGTFYGQWSSNNFSITHQKTAIFDAADSSGNPVSVDKLPSTANAIVSTGNFQGYEGAPFYDARDFYVTVTERALVAEIERVFLSDYNCDGRTEFNEESLTLPLVWSNGSTGVNPGDTGEYASREAGYPGYGYQEPNAVDQGNARGVTLDLIENAAAGDTLQIYNEEMSDPETVQALVNAAGEGVSVEVVMSAQSTESTQNNLASIASAGGTVVLFSNDASTLYVHAKMILWNPGQAGAQAFVGSENISGNSLNFNRELGLLLYGSDTDVLAQTFATDFGTTEGTATYTSANASSLGDTTVQPGVTPAEPSYGYQANTEAEGRLCGERPTYD